MIAFAEHRRCSFSAEMFLVSVPETCLYVPILGILRSSRNLSALEVRNGAPVPHLILSFKRRVDGGLRL